MAEGMRVILFLFAIIAPGVAVGLDFGEWSWRDGLLGDSPGGDIYRSEAGDYPGFLCVACRDPEDYPMDFAAFAYNGYWGDNPWMLSSQLGMPFRVYNMDLQWVAVWFEEVLFGAPLSLLPDTLKIHVRLETGQILTFMAVQGGPDLPVGSQEPAPETTVGTCACADDGGDGEADEDYAEPQDSELPGIEEEVFGTVEIIDPDENGEFPPWEEEL